MQWIKGHFFRDVITLVAGTAASQFVTLAFMPFITRLYGPEAFGGMGYFSSLLNFIAPLTAVSYTLAIVLPKTNREAQALSKLSLRIGGGVTLLVGICIALVDRFFDWIPFSDAHFYIPAGGYLTLLVAIVSQWALRQRKFKILSMLTFTVALFTGLLKIFLGWYFPYPETLIIVSLVGLTLMALSLFIFLRGPSVSSWCSISLKKQMYVLKKYWRFPALRMPHALLAAASQISPVIFLGSIFGPAYAGYFALTRTVLSAPVNLVGVSVYNVSYPKITKRYNEGKGNYRFIGGVTLLLLLLSVLPTALIILWGEALFGWVFGSEWERAGAYSVWLSIWYALNFSNRAAVAAISVYKMDGFLLRNGVLNAALTNGGFLVGYYWLSSDISSVALFSFSGLLCQCLLVLGVLVRVKKCEGVKGVLLGGRQNG